MNLKIARIRELRGMKQETLADELSVSEQSVSNLEQSETQENLQFGRRDLNVGLRQLYQEGVVIQNFPLVLFFKGDFKIIPNRCRHWLLFPEPDVLVSTLLIDKIYVIYLRF